MIKNKVQRQTEMCGCVVGCVCMYACVCMCIYIYTYTYTHICVYIYISGTLWASRMGASGKRQDHIEETLHRAASASSSDVPLCDFSGEFGSILFGFNGFQWSAPMCNPQYIPSPLV